TDGGTVSNFHGIIGNNSAATNNLAFVSGTGSIWQNQSNLIVGRSGSGNQLIVSNGGLVSSGQGHVGGLSTDASSSIKGDNNLVVITGGNSIWSNATAVIVG